MGVFVRPDSRFYQLYLEPDGVHPPKKLATRILCRDVPPEIRTRNKRLAEFEYHERMLARAEHRAHPHAKPPMTFTVYAAWFQEHVLSKRRGRERELEILPKLVAYFGATPLADITRKRATEYATFRLTTPTIISQRKRVRSRVVSAHASTVNREVDLLKAMLQAAVPEYLVASPLYGMPRLHAPTPKRRLLTEDEERRLLAVMAPDDTALFLIGEDSLVRLGDLLDLRREDDSGLSLWIRDPKRGGGFAVPLSTRARAALDAWYTIRPAAEDGKVDYLFPRRRRARTERDRRNGIRQMLERYCAAADPPIPFGRATGGITFHWATRRTGATRMLTRGIDPGTVQKVGRWKNPDIVLGIYHELLDEHAHAAVNAVGREVNGNRAGVSGPIQSRPVPTTRSERTRKSGKNRGR